MWVLYTGIIVSGSQASTILVLNLCYKILGYNEVAMYIQVCRGSVKMMTTSGFQSDHLGSSPSQGHYSMRLKPGRRRLVQSRGIGWA